MTYKEKQITITLVANLLLLGFYFLSLSQIAQDDQLTLHNAVSLWATVIVLGIIVNIVAGILGQIIMSIIEAVRTHEEPSYVEDERDEMISLKGKRNSYHVFGIGVFLSMLSLAIGQPALVMFNLLIFTAFMAEIVGDLSQLFFYRRGF